MKLGVMIEGHETNGWQEWRDLVQWTEELGFESLWRSDHYFSFGDNRGQDALETFVALVYAAQNSSRILLGPLVCSMTFRHPALVARMAAAIDQLSGGRLILGLGAGWNVSEHDAFGIPLPAPRPRIEALEEGIQVIKALFGQGRVSFEGKHYRLKEAQISPQPLQSPLPILIGGAGEKRTLGVVARHADQWNIGGPSIEFYRRKAAVLAEHCEREGRDPAEITHSLWCGCITGESDAVVERRAASMLRRLPERLRPQPGGRLGDVMFVGTPAQIVEQIGALEAEGVDRIMLEYRAMPAREDLEFVAREILPRVQA